jgi:hypothetical protein
MDHYHSDEYVRGAYVCPVCEESCEILVNYQGDDMCPACLENE